MDLPIWVGLVGLLGGVIVAPDHINPTTRSSLDSRTYIIGSVGEAYTENANVFVFFPKAANYPEFRAEVIYGGLSWASIEPRAAVTVNSVGGVWAGIGPSYTKYWQIGDGNALFVGANFLPGYADYTGRDESPAFAHRSGILFRSEFEFGFVTDRLRWSFFVDHRSNANISYPNFGYDTAGINIGYGF
jgi:hypothetical protein